MMVGMAAMLLKGGSVTSFCSSMLDGWSAKDDPRQFVVRFGLKVHPAHELIWRRLRTFTESRYSVYPRTQIGCPSGTISRPFPTTDLRCQRTVYPAPQMNSLRRTTSCRRSTITAGRGTTTSRGCSVACLTNASHRRPKDPPLRGWGAFLPHRIFHLPPASGAHAALSAFTCYSTIELRFSTSARKVCEYFVKNFTKFLPRKDDDCFI
jgi:hypothetical protein